MKSTLITLFVFFFLTLPLAAQHETAQDNCTAVGCHLSIIDQRVIHSPLEDGCDFCHESSAGPHPANPGEEFSLVEQVPALCQDCHDEMNLKKVVHDPVAEGDCLLCHSPHSSANLLLLNAAPAVKICEECHDSETWEKKIHHQPVRDGNCETCHNPHQSDYASLLKFEMPRLCFKCHEKESEQHQADNLHSPFEEDCVDCHAVHGADERILLNTKLPDLCFDCHDDLQVSIQEKKLVHTPLRENKLCLNCHSPHASGFAALLIKGQQKLCFECHGSAASSREKRSESVEDKLLLKKFIHDPVDGDGCSDCHDPHASDNTRLLALTFPGGNYTVGEVDSFALCFDCHDSELLKEPDSESATGFRNGTTNLHYLHINQKKGRNCINCHDIHAANNDHLLAEEVHFGKWKMPLNFKQSENGGSCLPGCHEEKKYEQ